MLPASSKPYLVRAIYEWCVDQGYTPYIMVVVDEHCRVPKEHVRDGVIVLDVSPEAVRDFFMDNEWVGFAARFGGVSRDISFPITAISAVYAKETQEGMGFEVYPYKGETASESTGKEDSVKEESPTSSSSSVKKSKFSLVD